MAIKHETELYAPLKAFFEGRGYSVKGEVKSCDLVGLRGEEPPLIVELKKSFNLSLLLQGVERLRLSPDVYLAVERCRDKKGAVNQRWGELSGLCRRVGVGLITVTFYKTKAPLVEVLAEPGELPRERRSPRRQERLLLEFRERSGDYNTGGSARVKLVTAYREKALRVAASLAAAEAEALAAGGAPGAKPAGSAATGKAAPAGTSPAELRRRSGVPAAAAILQRNYYGWFTRVNRGRYALTAAGRAALLEYSAAVEAGAALEKQNANAQEPPPE